MTASKTPRKKLVKGRRMPKVLSQNLYCYTSPEVRKYAHTYGRKSFGSASAYVDALIRADKEKRLIPAPRKTA